ncbi:RNA-binding protein [Pseudomonas daroniae]|uniref:Dual-specificity RNA pseudouridine synthase RluF n=1 Tax=Phytopseudomonas daroniae TaxID=2487519 RepID=A0A4V2KB96_9GAMM|nr:MULTISPECIES: rRNA pseudouridine synthase [Pseudomonas]TBU83488.1 RNA-binding protein [Pseudomonas daroniae]TBU85127.1 RNA-binding protein [Pseudomonas sp. FRB 228]TBU93580.1 RNA-binding protein [Pseudomonas daroniae]
MTEPLRLSKRLIELTGCSRREAELYIEGGWVTVDGEIVDEPQRKVQDETVVLLPDAVAQPQEPVTLLLNVPSGRFPERAAEEVTPDKRWPEDRSELRTVKGHFDRLTPCIPLQAGADGLHVLTQDWRIERKLKEDLSKLEQEYVVEVSGELSERDLKRLNHGLVFNGTALPPCKVSWQNETRLRFALKNPLPGQLVFMCNSVGLKVLGMKRIRIGGVPMSKVQPGQWRYLGAKERF